MSLFVVVMTFVSSGVSDVMSKFPKCTAVHIAVSVVTCCACEWQSAQCDAGVRQGTCWHDWDL